MINKITNITLQRYHTRLQEINNNKGDFAVHNLKVVQNLKKWDATEYEMLAWNSTFQFQYQIEIEINSDQNICIHHVLLN